MGGGAGGGEPLETKKGSAPGGKRAVRTKPKKTLHPHLYAPTLPSLLPPASPPAPPRPRRHPHGEPVPRRVPVLQAVPLQSRPVARPVRPAQVLEQRPPVGEEDVEAATSKEDGENRGRGDGVRRRVDERGGGWWVAPLSPIPSQNSPPGRVIFLVDLQVGRQLGDAVGEDGDWWAWWERRERERGVRLIVVPHPHAPAGEGEGARGRRRRGGFRRPCNQLCREVTQVPHAVPPCALPEPPPPHPLPPNTNKKKTHSAPRTTLCRLLLALRPPRRPPAPPRRGLPGIASLLLSAGGRPGLGGVGQGRLCMCVLE